MINGALREPGEMMMFFIPLARQISIMLCAKGILG
jgi:hypothetical protein